MMEKPILFSGEMVRAILEGRKMQTRRVINFPLNVMHYGKLLGDWSLSEIGKFGNGVLYYTVQTEVDDCKSFKVKCPYGTVGTHLWVRETWSRTFALDDDSINGYCYKATNNGPEPYKWKPSIHMPRCASRLTLEVKEIRVERLQGISEDDAEKEGVNPYTAPAEMPAYKPAFADIWDKINYDRGYGWNVNPWVWVVVFEILTSPIK